MPFRRAHSRGLLAGLASAGRFGRPNSLLLAAVLVSVSSIDASAAPSFASVSVGTPSPGASATVSALTSTLIAPGRAERQLSTVLVAGDNGGETQPQIAVGGRHTCALMTDGTVRCWGDNSRGQLGDGTTVSRLHPVQVLEEGSEQGVSVLSGVAQISAGEESTCVRLTDGTARCWGSNGNGRLGDGTIDNRLNPVEVLAPGEAPNGDALQGVVEISTARDHACARIDDETLRCWGANGRGRLGDGTATTRLSPVRVLASGTQQDENAFEGVVSVSTGSFHTCASLRDGEARCWGDGTRGRLGNGSTGAFNLHPVPMLDSASNLGGVARALSGELHTCVLMGDSSARCTGDNRDGRLGDGTSGTDRTRPLGVLTAGSTQGSNVLRGLNEVATGMAHTCGLIEGGTVLCWGGNGYGQLGDGTKTLRLNPVAVLSGESVLSGVRQVSTSPRSTHTCALLVDETVRCWGDNRNGQLGDATEVERLLPVPVLASGVGDSGLFTVRVAATQDSGSEGGSLLAVSCEGMMTVGTEVACTITGGDPGIEILWRAAHNPPFAGAGVTLDGAGSGTFGFTVPAAALGQVLTVELVDWLAPASLGVAGGPMPASVPSGGGPMPVWSLVMLTLAGGLVVARRSRGASSASSQG